MIQAKDVRFAYRVRRSAGSDFVFQCASFRAQPGAITCVVGGNGSGKTTLLGLLRGKWCPDEGDVLLEGRPVRAMTQRELRRTIGWVDATATDALVGHLLVVDHVALALGDAGQRVPLFHRNLRDIDLPGTDGTKAGPFNEVRALLRKRVGELSSGQRQMLTIALALAGRRRVVLADETTAHLDFRNARAFFETLRAATVEGIAAVAVTHDLLLAAEYANRVFAIRQGVVEEMPLASPFSVEGRLREIREFLADARQASLPIDSTS